MPSDGAQDDSAVLHPWLAILIGLLTGIVLVGSLVALLFALSGGSL